MTEVNITCKKATLLISMKEEGKLSFTQRLQLRMHLSVCSMCKLFEKQSLFISKNARHLHEHSDTPLSSDAKGRMSKVIKEATSGK